MELSKGGAKIVSSACSGEESILYALSIKW